MIMGRWCSKRMEMRGIISARTIIREKKIKRNRSGKKS